MEGWLSAEPYTGECPPISLISVSFHALATGIYEPRYSCHDCCEGMNRVCFGDRFDSVPE